MPKRPSRKNKKTTHSHLAAAVERNIAALLEARRQTDRSRSSQDKVADAITRFSGSMPFLYLHALWFLGWIVVNMGWLREFGVPPFDPFPFGLLTMVVSLEAIFLSTVVLISQNREARIADQRADLDLQVDLLAEHEVTKLLVLVDALVEHAKLRRERDHELPDLESQVDPQELLRAIEKRRKALKL